MGYERTSARTEKPGALLAIDVARAGGVRRLACADARATSEASGALRSVRVCRLGHGPCTSVNFLFLLVFMLVFRLRRLLDTV